MLSVYFAHGAKSEAFQRHIARIDDYLWVAEDGECSASSRMR